MSAKLFDVVAVNLQTQRIRMIDEQLCREDAEAVQKFAIIRRGVEEECFFLAPVGKYCDDAKWCGA